MWAAMALQRVACWAMRLLRWVNLLMMAMGRIKRPFTPASISRAMSAPPPSTGSFRQLRVDDEACCPGRGRRSPAISRCRTPKRPPSTIQLRHFSPSEPSPYLALRRRRRWASDTPRGVPYLPSITYISAVASWRAGASGIATHTFRGLMWRVEISRAIAGAGDLTSRPPAAAPQSDGDARFLTLSARRGSPRPTVK